MGRPTQRPLRRDGIWAILKLEGVVGALMEARP